MSMLGLEIAAVAVVIPVAYTVLTRQEVFKDALSGVLGGGKYTSDHLQRELDQLLPAAHRAIDLIWQQILSVRKVDTELIDESLPERSIHLKDILRDLRQHGSVFVPARTPIVGILPDRPDWHGMFRPLFLQPSNASVAELSNQPMHVSGDMRLTKNTIGDKGLQFSHRHDGQQPGAFVLTLATPAVRGYHPGTANMLYPWYATRAVMSFYKFQSDSNPPTPRLYKNHDNFVEHVNNTCSESKCACHSGFSGVHLTLQTTKTLVIQAIDLALSISDGDNKIFGPIPDPTWFQPFEQPAKGKKPSSSRPLPLSLHQELRMLQAGLDKVSKWRPSENVLQYYRRVYSPRQQTLASSQTTQ